LPTKITLLTEPAMIALSYSKLRATLSLHPAAASSIAVFHIVLKRPKAYRSCFVRIRLRRLAQRQSTLLPAVRAHLVTLTPSTPALQRARYRR
jgi:multisubunit Na+/H+ antiporter MnhE subunit